MVNVDKYDLLLHIVELWRTYAVDEGNRFLPVVIYSSGMMYKYYYHLKFIPIKHTEKENASIKIIQQYNIFHQNCLHVNCLHYGFVMYNVNLLIRK